MEKSDRVDSFLLGSLLRMCHIALWKIRKKLKGNEESEPAESRNNREIQRRWQIISGNNEGAGWFFQRISPPLPSFNDPWFSLPSLQPGIAKVSLVLTPIIWPITASDANCIHVHWSSMITVKPYQGQCAMRMSLSKRLDWQNNGSVVCVIHSCTFHCCPLQNCQLCLIAVKCMHVSHLNFKTSFVNVGLAYLVKKLFWWF